MKTLKNVICSINAPRATIVVLAAVAAVAGMQGQSPLLAQSPGSTSEQASQAESGAGGNAGPGAGTAENSEVTLLSKALDELKAGKANEAINNLCRLKDQYPDNDDYLLLYRTALRIRKSNDGDSQKWYSYVRSLDKKEEEKHAFLDASKDALSTPSQGRINQLKRANWLILTTGKYKSALMPVAECTRKKK